MIILFEGYILWKVLTHSGGGGGVRCVMNVTQILKQDHAPPERKSFYPLVRKNARFILVSCIIWIFLLRAATFRGKLFAPWKRIKSTKKIDLFAVAQVEPVDEQLHRKTTTRHEAVNQSGVLGVMFYR